MNSNTPTQLIYFSHWRFPSEKTMSPLIMKTCEGLASRGIRVELWIPWRNNKGFSDKDPFAYHRVDQNFIIRRIPTLDLTGIIPGNISFLVMLATFNIALFFAMLVYRIPKTTVLYFHDQRDMASLLWFRNPMFLEIHDFYKSSLGFLNRWCFSRVTGFLVTNVFKMRQLHDEFGIPESRMLHQPNVVDVKMFAIDMDKKDARMQLHLPQDQTIVLYTGHLFDWKGVDTLFDAHEFLTEQYMIYFVGGTDDDIALFRKRCVDKNTRNITIVGRRPHAEIPLWQRAADLLVLPNTAKDPASKYETSPVKLFEYMASGRPLIASDLPSIRNVVDETTVFFFEPDNARALADRIQDVVGDPEEIVRRTSVARVHVREFTWEKRTEHVISLIRSCGVNI